MSTKYIMFLAFFCLVASMAHAQAPKKTGNEWHAAGNAIPRSRSFAQKMDSALHLGPELKKKVFQAYLANTKSVDEISFSSKSDQEKKALLKSNKTDFDRKLKTILPGDKYAGFEKLMLRGLK